MTQFNAPVKKTGGGVNVYTGLLAAAFIVLLVGVVMLAMRNIEHSKDGSKAGGVLTLVDSR